ncbi:MAG: hypothetical protein SOR38_02765 [Oscillospiraceae bacterium]|nr:hypothetical protein [Oscillospiraceae bacterium]MDY3064719.1 hypothetical protein [Oscillospiraceae bacterium]
MDRIDRLNKRAVLLIALFLLAVLTSFAGQVITISDGGYEYRLLLQYIPALAVGAAAVFILYYGGMFRECCLGSAPVYGLIGSAVTLVWALCSGNQTMPFFSLLAKSPAALFAQSEYRYADGRACLTPAPFAGCLTTAVAGAMLVLSLLAFRRIAGEKDMRALLRPDATAILFLFLPLLSGFAEYGVNTLSYLFSDNYFSISPGLRVGLMILQFGAYLLFGLLLGFFSVQKSCSVFRWLSVLILAAGAVMWYVVVWAFGASAIDWLSQIGRVSIYSSGAYFGFVMGVSLRTLRVRR